MQKAAIIDPSKEVVEVIKRNTFTNTEFSFCKKKNKHEDFMEIMDEIVNEAKEKLNLTSILIDKKLSENYLNNN